MRERVCEYKREYERVCVCSFSVCFCLFIHGRIAIAITRIFKRAKEKERVVGA